MSDILSEIYNCQLILQSIVKIFNKVGQVKNFVIILKKFYLNFNNQVMLKLYSC